MNQIFDANGGEFPLGEIFVDDQESLKNKYLNIFTGVYYLCKNESGKYFIVVGEMSDVLAVPEEDVGFVYGNDRSCVTKPGVFRYEMRDEPKVEDHNKVAKYYDVLDEKDEVVALVARKVRNMDLRGAKKLSSMEKEDVLGMTGAVPFLENGNMFCFTSNNFSLGQLLLSPIDTSDKFAVSDYMEEFGKVMTTFGVVGEKKLK